MTVQSIYVLFANGEEAMRIGRAMIEERLAACVNILAPCTSIYRWDGQIETATEVPALFKTDETTAAALIDRVAALHSYDVPGITAWAVEKAHGPYADWVQSSVQADG